MIYYQQTVTNSLPVTDKITDNLQVIQQDKLITSSIILPPSYDNKSIISSSTIIDKTESIPTDIDNGVNTVGNLSDDDGMQVITRPKNNKNVTKWLEMHGHELKVVAGITEDDVQLHIKSKYSTKIVLLAVKMRTEKGMLFRKIAEELKIPETTIKTCMTKLNIKR